ncbi:MAG TPA: VWA domain-containing protein [Pirellulales bacterium]|jgi:Mg-chelatase subunit ChlD|nr:VWA domain-containing protein [Pirellulales bacterium]
MLGSLPITFEKPLWLLLLLALPPLWWWSVGKLAALGPLRKYLALLLRSAIVLMVVAALAELRLVQENDRLTVIYLLDQSASIPAAQRHLMLDFVQEDVKQHRRVSSQDRAGVIVFGSDARIEIPPLDADVSLSQVEVSLDADHTNIADAIKLAKSLFSPNSAQRIVLVSDGNENSGNALREVQNAAGGALSIDVVPVHYPARVDVAVEKVSVPADTQIGQGFEVRVLLDNMTPRGSGPTLSGKLVLTREMAEKIEPVSEQHVQLPPGKTVLTARDELDSAAFYTYRARFEPDAQTPLSGSAKNKTASAFTQVKGVGRILLIEDWERRGEHDALVKLLRNNNFDVTVEPSNSTFDSLAKLQFYDCVILANVPRASGFDIEEAGGGAGGKIGGLSDAQVEMLVRNTQQLGGGLIVLGGDNSFGAGGWTGTELEKALPIDFQVKDLKVSAIGALELVIDRSGSMSGEKLELCKVAAREAVKALSDKDYIGILAFDDQTIKLVPIQKADDRAALAAQIGRLSAGGGTNMYPGMLEGFEQLRHTNAALKHMIVLTDGETMPGDFDGLVKAMQAQGISVSTVGVGQDADEDLLRSIARLGKGKFYKVNSARAVPRIFSHEARRVARPVIFESAGDMRPIVKQSHEIISNWDPAQAFPPIRGYVLSQLKAGPLVEQVLAAPLPTGAEGGNTILATWQYGVGRAVAFTTDVGNRWAKAWPAWSNYEKFFLQMVRWSLRTSNNENFAVDTSLRDGQVQVTVTALDNQGNYQNFLQLTGSLIDPNLKAANLQLSQTAPGRYVGAFAAPAAGNYFVSLTPIADRPGQPPTLLQAAINVPYSSEFLDREPNDPLLNSLASAGASQAGAGRSLGTLTDRASLPALLAANSFRHDLPPARRLDDAWHLLLLAACCLFLGDVFVRRVLIRFDWIGPWARRLRNRLFGQTVTVTSPTLARLRSTKSRVASQMAVEQRSLRFEPSPDAAVAEENLDSLLAPGAAPRPADARPAVPAAPTAEEDYTARLLAAKRKARGE